MSFFKDVPLAPSDPILGLTSAFQKDPRKNKVNLGVGLYKTADLKTPLLNSVKAAEAELLKLEKSKEYLPIDGDPLFLETMGALVFGESKWANQKQRIAAFQTVGGTGALKIGGTFIKEELKSSLVISNPTWPNHRGVFISCGLSVENYYYYDMQAQKADFHKMVADLEKLSERTVVVLHACCHNPTGCDPTLEEWKFLCDLFKKKKLIPFFDFAYQGFGRSLDEDAEAVRHFLKSEIEMLVAISNAKNFSLYGERVGCLFIVGESAKIADHIVSRVKQMIRTTYSNPPIHGAKIVAYVLSTPSLRKEWEHELGEMRKRIDQMRMCLFNRLAELGKANIFHQISKGRGMFGFTGLNKTQVDRIITDYGIYMTSDGRINFCGLNSSNLDYVAEALINVY
jgi:aspartate/tyrosine/aromatic aminotransferase